MMPQPEPRYPADFKVYVAWQDSKGNIHRCKARCLDISKSGFRIETIDALPHRGLVDVESETHSRLGHATVRYCQRYGMKYSVGLEFSSTVTLREQLRLQAIHK